jgi:hypothetical protein
MRSFFISPEMARYFKSDATISYSKMAMVNPIAILFFYNFLEDV